MGILQRATISERMLESWNETHNVVGGRCMMSITPCDPVDDIPHEKSSQVRVANLI